MKAHNDRFYAAFCTRLTLGSFNKKNSFGGSPKLFDFKVRGTQPLDNLEPKLPLPARANFSGYAYDVLSAINIDLREERHPLAVIDFAEQ